AADGFVARLNAGLTALEQATYIGGSDDDDALALAIEPTTGDVYVAGFADSRDRAGTNGGAQSAFGGLDDGFVARLNGNLTALEQATFLGGSGAEEVSALAIVATTGDVYAGGSTGSPNFPGTSGGAQSALVGIDNGFVARLNSNLTALDQATYLGGGTEHLLAGQPTMTRAERAGLTASSNFPDTGNGVQTALAGDFDAFIARLSAGLTALDQATYLGGPSSDAALALAIGPTTGDVYVAGLTTSTVFPGTAGGAQSAF